MAGKKKIELFNEINNQKDFDYIVNHNSDRLICAEIFSAFSGSCNALDRLFTTIKLDWSDGRLVLLKVLADEIEVLARFREQSEPVYMFIINKKATKVFRGVDSVRFGEVVRIELRDFEREMEDTTSVRVRYELWQATPGEMDWINSRAAKELEATRSQAARLAERQAARKQHRAELMVPHVEHLCFVLFWPHAKRAHPELYERWDDNNIIMVGREELHLDDAKALDILYAGDAPINDASLHTLVSGPALAICFRLLDTDKHFRPEKEVLMDEPALMELMGRGEAEAHIPLVRKILYEDVPPLDETKPVKGQPLQMTAFDCYQSYSPTREQIWQRRREERKRRREELIEQRARRLSEMQRLARLAREEAAEAMKRAKEELKLELLKSGNLKALEELRGQPDNEVFDIEIPAELPDEMPEDKSDDEDEAEYFPPAGLLVPGFYVPPNDVAKANGLAILFPKLVLDHVTPQQEFLPPHVLVLLHIQKRHKAIAAMSKHRSAIIHMGVFKGSTPYNAVHIAYTVKQFESMDLCVPLEELRLAFMVSITVDLPLLELMDLCPPYVSRDEAAGEDECAAMFCLNYGDDYPNFEDFD